MAITMHLYDDAPKDPSQLEQNEVIATCIYLHNGDTWGDLGFLGGGWLTRLKE